MSQDRLGGFSSTSYGAIGNSGEAVSFENISHKISDRIFKINSKTSELERSGKKLEGRTSDVANLTARIHNIQQGTNGLIVEVTSLLRSLHDIPKPGDKQQRIQCERLTASFKTAVERYSSIQKQVSDKVKSASLLSAPSGYDESRDTWSEEATLLEQEKRREQLQQQRQMIEDDVEFAREREARIRQLEADIIDVNTIFKDLGAMVFEQGELVDGIEDNVTDAVGNIEEGNQQLAAASSYQKAYRKKLCILVIILVIVAGVIALIVGLSVKHH